MGSLSDFVSSGVTVPSDGDVGSYVVAGDLATSTDGTARTPGYTTSGANLVYSKGPGPLAGQGTGDLTVVDTYYTSFGYSGTWSLRTKIEVNTTDRRPVGLWVRTA